MAHLITVGLHMDKGWQASGSQNFQPEQCFIQKLRAWNCYRMLGKAMNQLQFGGLYSFCFFVNEVLLEHNPFTLLCVFSVAAFTLQ